MWSGEVLFPDARNHPITGWPAGLAISQSPSASPSWRRRARSAGRPEREVWKMSFAAMVRANSQRGVAILTSHDPEPWIWTRVAGDLVDIATVATGRRQDDRSRARSTLALATLATVTFVDLACANGLNAEKGNRKTAIRDYSRRSGFPKGVQVARGSARDFEIPDDMRTPELLRPWDAIAGGRKA